MFSAFSSRTSVITLASTLKLLGVLGRQALNLGGQPLDL
jgi:hypothetical protein